MLHQHFESQINVFFKKKGFYNVLCLIIAIETLPLFEFGLFLYTKL